MPRDSRRHLVIAAAVLVLLAAHTMLFHVLSRAELSVSIVAGAFALAAMKFVWWKSRHREAKKPGD